MFWKLLTPFIIAIAVLVIIFFEILDAAGRLDILEKKHPKLWDIFSKAPARLLLLVLCIGLLAKDVRDATEIQEL